MVEPGRKARLYLLPHRVKRRLAGKRSKVNLAPSGAVIGAERQAAGAEMHRQHQAQLRQDHV
jgi:hypothetical protein